MEEVDTMTRVSYMVRYL